MISTSEWGRDNWNVMESPEDPALLLKSGTSGGTVGSDCYVSKRPGSSSSSSELFSAKIAKIKMSNFPVCYRVSSTWWWWLMTSLTSTLQIFICGIITYVFEFILHTAPRSLITSLQRGKKFRFVSLEVGVEIMVDSVSFETQGFPEAVQIQLAYDTWEAGGSEAVRRQKLLSHSNFIDDDPVTLVVPDDGIDFTVINQFHKFCRENFSSSESSILCSFWSVEGKMVILTFYVWLFFVWVIDQSPEF